MPAIKWTMESIKAGFDRYYSENGRYPTALEIDAIEYLPSSRQIQRRFGGLENLRSSLGHIDVNFGKGIHRAKIASRVNLRGRQAELKIEKKLREKFGEAFVHTEKIFDDSKNRIDFYIYSPDGNFGVDIFCADNPRTLQGNVNAKLPKYRSFKERLFFVLDGDEIDQEQLDLYSQSKRKEMPQNVTLVTTDNLFQTINQKRAYSSPF